MDDSTQKHATSSLFPRYAQKGWFKLTPLPQPGDLYVLKKQYIVIKMLPNSL